VDTNRKQTTERAIRFVEFLHNWMFDDQYETQAQHLPYAGTLYGEDNDWTVADELQHLMSHIRANHKSPTKVHGSSKGAY
jgi:hypothetical protein